MSFVDDILSDVQGNVLKGFDKPHMRLIFFRFGNDKEVTKKWLSKLARRVPSTRDLIKAAKAADERKSSDPLYRRQDVWIHVSLSKSGIEKLDRQVPPSAWVYEHDGERSYVIEKNPDVTRHPFTEGMKSRAVSELGDIEDSAPENWIEPFRSADTGVVPLKGTEIDALMIVASDQQDDGDAYAMRLIEEATTHIGAIYLSLQIGTAFQNEAGRTIEHFGFRDGMSQPLIKGVDDERIQRNRTINKDEFDPTDFILHGLEGNFKWANNGSFLVFRRLSQNVPAFWDFMTKESEKLKSKGVDLSPDDLAAKFVGRWKSGAPLALHPKHDPVDPIDPRDPKDTYNDFVYVRNIRQIGSIKPDAVLESREEGDLNDPKGEVTPRFSHIRKVNPRDDGRSRDGPDANLRENRKHRILRRVITYGVPWAKEPNSKEADEDIRGLLFMCYQRDLEQQFEHIQKLWINNPEFPLEDHVDVGGVKLTIRHGLDPIAGHPRKGVPLNLYCRTDGSVANYLQVSMSQWVTTRGGEYFFSPSISALKGLSKSDGSS